MFIVKRQINYLQLRRSDMYLTLGLSSPVARVPMLGMADAQWRSLSRPSGQASTGRTPMLGIAARTCVSKLYGVEI